MSEKKPPLFWENTQKEIPPRPDFPQKYPESDSRHWHDREYAGWHCCKKPQPVSRSDGPKGKKVMALVPGDHPYSKEFQKGMEQKAESYGIHLKILDSQWDSDLQEQQLDRTLKLKPDMIILWAEDVHSGSRMIRKAYEKKIPLIASNFTPSDEDYPFILAWTGPDDWGQFRMLARRFASFMGNRGGYAIVCHRKETSTYYARSWAAITELNKTAPAMELLAMQSTDLDREKTCQTVSEWLSRYGCKLKGIISADDSVTQQGINQAIHDAGREDIICVANGSTPDGLRYVAEGKLKAITYQDPQRDGGLAVQVCADWFNGIAISPMNPLPLHIIDQQNIGSLISTAERRDYSPDYLYHLMMEYREDEVKRYFKQLSDDLSNDSTVTMDFFRGFTLEILSNLMNIIRTLKLPSQEFIGDADQLFKKLFLQSSMEKTLAWLREIALEIIQFQKRKINRQASLIDQIIHYAAENYNTPLSLKVLAYHFNISSPYLGRLFKQETGESFPVWLNKLRLNKAEEMMKKENLTATQAALEVGYTNSSYFFSLFKKYRGINPGEFLDSLSD